MMVTLCKFIGWSAGGGRVSGPVALLAPLAPPPWTLHSYTARHSDTPSRRNTRCPGLE